MHQLPVLIDSDLLAKRLLKEEGELMVLLAALEGRTRKFEDIERPLYESWLRLELGPRMMSLEEIFLRIHERRLFVQRIQDLMETERLSPREALFGATQNRDTSNQKQTRGKAWDADEIQARRQAKLEAKRTARKLGKKKNQPNPESTRTETSSSGPSRLVSLYRGLARRLHPDSPSAIQGLPTAQIQSLWLEVQSAYESANAERLLAIAVWLDQGSEKEGTAHLLSSVLTFSERFERLRSLKKSCVRLEIKLKQWVDHPAWEFENLRGKARRTLRQKAARELEDEIAETQEVLDALDDFIESIGTPKAPKSDKRTGNSSRR